jgi:hypothetical protein
MGREEIPMHTGNGNTEIGTSTSAASRATGSSRFISAFMTPIVEANLTRVSSKGTCGGVDDTDRSG